MNTKFLVNILIVLLVIVALFILYFQFSGSDDETPELIRSGDIRGSDFASVEQSEFLVLLNVVRNIKFDDSILSRKEFTSDFKDFTTELPILSTGRKNPFAGYGVGNFNFSSTETEIETEATATSSSDGSTGVPTDE